jgi:hypothetical protein
VVVWRRRINCDLDDEGVLGQSSALEIIQKHFSIPELFY